MTLYEIEPRCDRVKRKTIKGFDGFECACPACRSRGEDKAGTNGSVREGGDDWLHPHCQKGCSQSEFMEALGLTDEDRRIVPIEPGTATRPPKPRSEKYPYTNARGTVIFTKERYYVWDDDHPEKGWQKRFSQKTPDGQNIETIGSKADVLFNLPDIKRAKDEGLTVYVNEGEKAANAFKGRGLVGTCTNNGASSGSNLSGKWKPAHTNQIKGVKHVVIVADLDAIDDKTGRIVGEDFAAFVAGQLYDVVDRVEVVQSATTGRKDDAYDHFSAGHEVDAFVPRRDLLPEDADNDKLSFFAGDEPEAEANWLLDDYLLAGKCTLLDGKQGTGKTTLCLQWAAAFSHGQHPFLTKNYKPVPLPCGPIRTLYIHKGEDTDDEIKHVFRENGGVPGYLAVYRDVAFKLNPEGLSKIKRLIKRNGFRYVIIDNLIYFLALAVKSINDADQVAPIMMLLNEVASETGAAFHNLRHFRKTGGDEDKIDLSEVGLGTVIIAASHRGQMVIQTTKKKPGVFYVSCERGSLFAPPGESFAFRKIGLEAQYLPNEIHPREQAKNGDDLSEKAKAREMLRNSLTCKFEVKVKDIEETAANLGISIRTLQRARRELSVVSEREKKADGKYFMRIPDPFEGEDFDPWQ